MGERTSDLSPARVGIVRVRSGVAESIALHVGGRVVDSTHVEVDGLLYQLVRTDSTSSVPVPKDVSCHAIVYSIEKVKVRDSSAFLFDLVDDVLYICGIAPAGVLYSRRRDGFKKIGFFELVAIGFCSEKIRTFSLMRYPGSKGKMADLILGLVPPDIAEFREPFVGSGQIGIRVVDRFPDLKIWLNDFDYGVYGLLKAIQEDSEFLKDRCRKFRPSVELFDEYKATDGDKSIDAYEAGFRKLVLHQTSYGGLGSMAGSCLGGSDQESEFNVKDRWSPIVVERRVNRLSEIFGRAKDVTITNLDYEEVMENGIGSTFVYLDPPYVKRGPELYKNSMDDESHARLARVLLESKTQWLLSYDDHPLIRSLYEKCEIREEKMKYTVGGATGKEKVELLIGRDFRVFENHRAQRGTNPCLFV